MPNNIDNIVIVLHGFFEVFPVNQTITFCKFFLNFPLCDRIVRISISCFLQEVVFNAVSCFFYLSASSYMGFAVNVWLYPRFAIQSGYMAYPAMTAVYVSK